MAAEPRWFTLVRRYPNTRGPTIPFVVGALRKPIGSALSASRSRAELGFLLRAMRDDPIGNHQVAIVWCGVIGQLVVSVEFAGGVSPSFYRAFASDITPGRALFVERTYGQEVDTFQALEAALWAAFRAPICDSRFSFHRHDASWRPFTDEEIERVAEVLKPTE